MRRLRFFWQYLFKPRWDSGIPAPELVRAIAQRPLGNALDLGCGTGTNVYYLAEHGWRVTGIDFVPNAIAQARRKNRAFGAQVTLLVDDVTQLEHCALAGPFDLALDLGCLHGLPRHQLPDYVAGLRRWLAPGALFLLYAMHPGVLFSGGPGLVRTDVENLFRAGFRWVNYEVGMGRPSAWYYLERL